MMRNAEATEANLLDAIVSRYQSEGFDTFVHPTRSILPEFLRDIPPDAIAIGPKKKIAVEIIRSNGPRSKKIENLRKLFANQRDWELAVFYVSQSSTPEIRTLDLNTIKISISEINDLKDSGHPLASLMMGWSIFESVARAILQDQLERPQPPAQLLEILASQGFLTPTDADRLRVIAGIRNQVAHGGLDVRVSPEQLEALTAAIHSLVRRLEKKV